MTIGEVARGGGLNGTAAAGPEPATLQRHSAANYGPQVNFTIWLLTALSAMFLALRVYCKFLRHRGLWWDDHILIASWICLATACGFVSYTITLGFGQPLHKFDFHFLVPYLLHSNMAGSFSILAALWSKTSFAITVLRISAGWTKKFVWFIIVSVNIALGLSIAFTWGQCVPFQKIYNPSLPGHCLPKKYQIRYNIFTAAYSGAMDIVLAVVPWKIIWTLTMNKKEKFGVLVAMSMGIFAGITSLIKITTLPGIGNSDFTEATTQLVILATAESAITIMAASIPILRALIRDVHPPAGPAEFYHDMANVAGGGTDGSMYTGTSGTRGTGRTSTTITSMSSVSRDRDRDRSSRASTRWSKEFFEGNGTAGGGGGINLRLKRWSGISGHHSRGSSAASALSHSNGRVHGGQTEAGGGQRQGQGQVVPQGRILTTEEVVVEYEKNEVWIGKAF
ncbi:hypothetical protein GE09DRAFT_1066142 [Coniochaeta sp. 2T2.1]|nr:hypothetical protein GE09DRAFT_1066142 [Coniochaeta sp. 2T2.1]